MPNDPVDNRPRSRVVLGVMLGGALAALPAVALVWWWQAPVPDPSIVETRTVVDIPRPWTSSDVAGAPTAGLSRSAAPATPGSPLHVQVSIAGDASAFSSSARVYVFVRFRGERMPLAVERYAVAELPVTVGFSGLDPSASLEVVARLSRSGNVTFDSGDLETVAPAGDAGPGSMMSLVLSPN